MAREAGRSAGCRGHGGTIPCGVLLLSGVDMRLHRTAKLSGGQFTAVERAELAAIGPLAGGYEPGDLNVMVRLDCMSRRFDRDRERSLDDPRRGGRLDLWPRCSFENFWKANILETVALPERKRSDVRPRYGREFRSDHPDRRETPG